MTGFQARLDRFPPVVCRLLAKHPWGPPFTSQEIASRSGLSEYKVVALSPLTSWDEVSVRDMRAFLKGCDMDFDNGEAMNRVRCYLKSKSKRMFVHLRRSKQKEYFAELAEIAMTFIAQNW